MVSVDPSHLAARVTPFGVGVNAPDVEVPKFGESLLFVCCISPIPFPLLRRAPMLDVSALGHLHAPCDVKQNWTVLLVGETLLLDAA